ncbi:glycolate oxidase subunit GlcE [Pseudomonas rhizosphaerae]|jgi:glycolate oxidase FAD binding subunit|uniref:Glycolate oxidase n=1 Tax=Pseudomonas rhizosphaerae TaxID=216142 RepID=A0A089Z1U8_9PSED|nr:glycolate oxidase [Pseudomonas rhizosphaerae]
MAERDFDASEQLLDQVRQALVDDRPLCIQGSASKAFLGRPSAGERLDTRAHCGIVSYDPTELVITARAGTPLQTLRAAVEEAGQMLPFEPPAYGEQATLGGTIAAGLSGPRRPWAGSARDYVLGTRVITGLGKHLRFGGEVMKNVAGYDLSRLLTGSFGALGVLTEVSLKVLPKPRACFSIKLSCDAERALLKLAEWGQQPMPISAACHSADFLYLRLESGEGSVAAAHERIGGEPIDSAFWDDLNEHRLPFFAQPEPLWRLSLPNNTGILDLPGEQLIDWGGAQRWLKSSASAASIRQVVEAVGGHVTCYTAGITSEPFQPLPDLLLRYHRQLKTQLDPQGIFNPGRLYAQL